MHSIYIPLASIMPRYIGTIQAINDYTCIPYSMYYSLQGMLQREGEGAQSPQL